MKVVCRKHIEAYCLSNNARQPLLVTTYLLILTIKLIEGNNGDCVGN